MNRRLALVALACATLLSACDKQVGTSPDGGTPFYNTTYSQVHVVGGKVAAAQVAEHALTGKFARYIGRDAGSGLLADADVRHAIDRTVTDRAMRDAIHHISGAATDAVAVDGKVAASRCDAANCNGENFAVYVDPASGEADVCFYDDVASSEASWFHPGGGTEKRYGSCLVG